MKDIYNETIEAVENGARFTVDFKKRSLKVDGKYIIKNGEYEGDLGMDLSVNPIAAIEFAYKVYQHSIPSERSERKRKRYFQALPECELSDEDMMFGYGREVAQAMLELIVLSVIIQNKINWDEIAPNKWFWQSSKYPQLIILKDWIVNNEVNND